MNCLTCVGKGCFVCGYSGKRSMRMSAIETNERYTSREVIEVARKTMGCIDFDPASCEVANRTVKATRFYTKEQNGLYQDWYGNGWCNPPYGRVYGANIGLQGLFFKKGIESYEHGDVMQMIFMLHSLAPYQAWFQKLNTYPICLSFNSLVFTNQDNEAIRDGHGCVFVYLGDNEQAFCDNFATLGKVYLPCVR